MVRIHHSYEIPTPLAHLSDAPMHDARKFYWLHRGLQLYRPFTPPIAHPSHRTGLPRFSFSFIFKYVVFVPLPDKRHVGYREYRLGKPTPTRARRWPPQLWAPLRRPPPIIKYSVLSICVLPRSK